MAVALDALFAPGTIGPIAVRNRIVMPPMATNYATWTGAVTERLIDYHAERARGGVGLITVEFTFVHPTGKISQYALGADDDARIPGLRSLAAAIHAGGAKASIQLAHGGRRSRTAGTGVQPIAPSAVPCVGGEVPRALTAGDIDRVVGWFVQAARRVREAGFDAVTLHLANGYLLQTFTSPYANRRTDDYGGSLEGRMRLPLRIIEGIRSEIDRAFPIICRVCVDEFVDGGLTLDEGQRMAQMLEAAGVAALDVTAGIPETMHIIGPPMAMPRGFLAGHARAIKQAVKIPVFAVGRIDPALGDRMIREGATDFVSMGRPLIADPDLPTKARDGQLEDVRPCIACNEACFQRLYANLDVSCVVNPRAGRERLFPGGAIAQPKTVLVVGGGPAGMMAAVTAAARGHRVVLCERGARLGGQLLMGDVPPHKEEIGVLREYLVRQVAKSGVETRLGTTVSKDLAKQVGADVVVLATGAAALSPSIPAVNATIVSAWDVLAGTAATGARVLVIGGGEVGCELAELLATRGKDVVLVELLTELCAGMEPRSRGLLVSRLRALGVTALLQTRVLEVRGATVTYEQGGVRSRIDAVDTVVSAVGSVADTTAAAMGPLDVPVLAIGDCVTPRRILEAIREGFELASSI